MVNTDGQREEENRKANSFAPRGWKVSEPLAGPGIAGTTLNNVARGRF